MNWVERFLGGIFELNKVKVVEKAKAHQTSKIE